VIALLSSLAKAESQKISVRTIAGLERARAEGKRLGQPPLPENIKVKVLRLYDDGDGRSMNAISKELGVGYGTVYRICRKS